MELIDYTLNLKSGELIKLRMTQDGLFVCPICGFIGFSEPPYALITEVNSVKLERPFAAGSFEVCPSCETEFGCDDSVPADSLNQQSGRRKELRESWLRDNNYSVEALNQLKNLENLED